MMIYNLKHGEILLKLVSRELILSFKFLKKLFVVCIISIFDIMAFIYYEVIIKLVL